MEGGWRKRQAGLRELKQQGKSGTEASRPDTVTEESLTETKRLSSCFRHAEKLLEAEREELKLEYRQI